MCINTGKLLVTVKPDQRVFRGERVTLTCDIKGGGNIQWRYSWIKDGNTVNPYTTTTADYSFTADVSLRGKYSCRGERSDSHTDFSDGVKLTVSGESSYSHLFNHHICGQNTFLMLFSYIS